MICQVFHVVKIRLIFESTKFFIHPVCPQGAYSCPLRAWGMILSFSGGFALALCFSLARLSNILCFNRTIQRVPALATGGISLCCSALGTGRSIVRPAFWRTYSRRPGRLVFVLPATPPVLFPPCGQLCCLPPLFFYCCYTSFCVYYLPLCMFIFYPVPGWYSISQFCCSMSVVFD